jgi:hypothetical protein
MRLPRTAPLLLSLPYLAAGVNINCEDIQTSGERFNLQKLAGEHHVSDVDNTGRVVTRNTTYSLNICGPLAVKGGNKEDKCRQGTRVCGITELTNKNTDKTRIQKVVNIAGNYETNAGGRLDPRWSLLQDSDSHADRDKEGLRLEMHGGKHPFKGKGKPQMAIIEFICDKSRTGLEDGGPYQMNNGTPPAAKRDDFDDDDDDDDDDSDRSLRFVSYGPQKKGMVLRLEWRTKWACVGMADDAEAGSNHWGFFTWFLIIVFLSAAAYLIFGSWLNYNRYGARGWDLVPHGDTIRDIPYLLKDWARGIAAALSGPGSRGGYTAV